MRVLILSFLCATWYVSYASGAPSVNALGPSARKDDMAERFIDFLKDDREFQNVIKHAFDENHLERRRRQADIDIDDGMEVETKKPGFFDRAAKFVSELLQRFLKWVNSSDDRK
ncbi:hypothetical protein PPYR_14017 [Photinus pyralis]|uniref:Uncharacterized protein n=1 Tax=Photinus pyralis TaxID=7054 RepID=A0A1Y1N0B2_PHOPY|nr:uncharacterized protein LOC116180967 [Photinus pyralis]KAB0792056.1 hypothetical protein PPYR_14017 [Photinus pyralis]